MDGISFTNSIAQNVSFLLKAKSLADLLPPLRMNLSYPFFVIHYLLFSMNYSVLKSTLHVYRPANTMQKALQDPYFTLIYYRYCIEPLSAHLTVLFKSLIEVRKVSCLGRGLLPGH